MAGSSRNTNTVACHNCFSRSLLSRSLLLPIPSRVLILVLFWLYMWKQTSISSELSTSKNPDDHLIFTLWNPSLIPSLLFLPQISSLLSFYFITTFLLRSLATSRTRYDAFGTSLVRKEPGWDISCVSGRNIFPHPITIPILHLHWNK